MPSFTVKDPCESIEVLLKAWKASLPNLTEDKQIFLGYNQAACLASLGVESLKLIGQLPLSRDKCRLVPGTIVWFLGFNGKACYKQVQAVRKDAILIDTGSSFSKGVWVSADIVFSCKKALLEDDRRDLYTS